MVLLNHIVALLTACVALASALPLFANSWWGFELFTHFRLQYLVLLSAFFLLHLTRRRWAWAFALLPFCFLSAYPVVPGLVVATSQDTMSPQLSIMNVNVQAENTNVAQLLEILRNELPDVVIVTEYNATWQTGLRSLAELYPHRIEAPQPGRFGIALLSRLPLREEEKFDLLTTAAISTHIELEGQSIRLIGVHLRPPMSARAAAVRNQQLVEISRLLENHSDPTVIVGDFNVTTYSPIFYDWLSDNQLRSTVQADGFGISWPAFLPLLGILIDHCVVSDEFIINDYNRGPAFGSDHYPVTSIISLRGAS